MSKRYSHIKEKYRGGVYLDFKTRKGYYTIIHKKKLVGYEYISEFDDEKEFLNFHLDILKSENHLIRVKLAIHERWNEVRLKNINRRKRIAKKTGKPANVILFA